MTKSIIICQSVSICVVEPKPTSGIWKLAIECDWCAWFVVGYGVKQYAIIIVDRIYSMKQPKVLDKSDDF